MSAVAKKHGIELTFFHGKGSTVGRGGNPALYRAILSHPPNTINGRFRVIEQGEMINKHYGSPAMAQRTLGIYTAAVLREAVSKRVKPTPEWRQQMERISEASCTEYRHYIREDPRFIPYFRQATPEVELGTLNFGSRPAKPNPKNGIESLRGIPWTFAWTQTRSLLPGWLGVGTGLQAKNETDFLLFREMYSDWPWFRETIDLIAAMLAKTDFSVALNYDTQLVEKEGGLKEFGQELRRKLLQTRQAVLNVSQADPRSMSLIHDPYLAPIHVVQAELLKRFRSLDAKGEKMSQKEVEQKDILKDALITSIKGIVEGMRNSG
jgi:phosphoenolpyruvate carboxylase